MRYLILIAVESSLLHMEMMTLAIVLGTVSYDLKTRRHWLFQVQVRQNSREL